MTRIAAFTRGQFEPSSLPRSGAGEDRQASFCAIIAQQMGASADREKPNHTCDAATPFAQLALFQQSPCPKVDADAAAPPRTEAAQMPAPATAEPAVAFEAAHYHPSIDASPLDALSPEAPPAAAPATQPKVRRPSSGGRLEARSASAPAPSLHEAPSPDLDQPAAKAQVVRARAHLNPVFVALHATDNELAVYARAGRMAPTERDRLRNAVTALLAEYGHFDAPVRLDGQTGGDRWRK